MQVPQSIWLMEYSNELLIGTLYSAIFGYPTMILYIFVMEPMYLRE